MTQEKMDEEEGESLYTTGSVCGSRLCRARWPGLYSRRSYTSCSICSMLATAASMKYSKRSIFFQKSTHGT